MSSLCSLKFEKTDFFKKIIHDDLRQIFDWKDVYLRKKLSGSRWQTLTPRMQVDPTKRGWDQDHQCVFEIANGRSSKMLPRL